MAARKPSRQSNHRVAPYNGESAGKGSYDDYEDDDLPVITAVAVAAKGAPHNVSNRVLPRSPSRSTSMMSQQRSSTHLLEPSAEDALPPPINPWPEGLRAKIVNKLSRKADAATGRAFLSRHRWPGGFQEEAIRSCKKIPLRFYIVDDSGSMITDDGRRVLSHGIQNKLIKCTRWAELSESVLFLAELSEALSVVTEFRLLNGSDPVVVGMEEDHQATDLQFLREVMKESPAGPTPLCAHIRAIVINIESIAAELRERNQKAVVVIATDGESTDGDVAQALKPLISLPVIVIVRLCTEEKGIIDYWNNIDNQLELDIDVLDDQLGDAKQVREVNGWLTYGEALHRIREFGASMKELDIIDEKTVTMEQMRVLCSYIYCNGNIEALPHPALSWNVFASTLKDLIRQQDKVFCPIAQTIKPWVDVSVLYKTYAQEIKNNNSGGGTSCVLC